MMTQNRELTEEEKLEWLEWYYQKESYRAYDELTPQQKQEITLMCNGWNQ